MNTIRLNENIPLGGKTIVTVGNFDGIHRGHQALFTRLIEEAKRHDAASCVVTFEPHTKAFIDPANTPPRLTTFDEKAVLLKNCGIDLLVQLSFDKAMSQMQGDEFIKKILMEKLNAIGWIMGDDHRFGADRHGSHNFLHNHPAINHFLMIPVELYGDDTILASSTAVRELILNDRIDEAVEMLGHPYPIMTERTCGVKKGTEMGYPTFNFSSPPSQKFIPKPGVYAAQVEYREKKLIGALYFGNCPTFENRDYHFEFHALESIDVDPLPQERCLLWVHSFLRHDATFSSQEALVEQIKKDIVNINCYFNKE